MALPHSANTNTANNISTAFISMAKYLLFIAKGVKMVSVRRRRGRCSCLFRSNWKLPKSFGISGDGSCLFRAVVYDTCLRRGKPAPSETHQKELANELRENVVDELVKGRKYTEWYLEDEFDRYVCQMRQSHVWGGKPEHYLASGSPKTQPDHLFVISS